MGIWCLEMATGNCGCGQDWQVVIASISPILYKLLKLESEDQRSESDQGMSDIIKKPKTNQTKQQLHLEVEELLLEAGG